MSILDFFRPRKQLSDLRRDVDAMRSDFKIIRDEWDDWFDRFRRLHARIARRQARDEAGADNDVREDAPTADGENGGTNLSGLSAAAAEAQRKILARRMNRLPRLKEE